VIRNPYVGAGGLSMAFSPDGRTVMVQSPPNPVAMMAPGAGVGPGGNTSTTLRMWDVATGKEVRKIILPTQRGGGSIAVAPDGRVVASENTDRTVSLWEIASGKERGQFGKALAAAPAANPNMPLRFAVAGFGGIGQAVPAGRALAFSDDGALLAC